MTNPTRRQLLQSGGVVLASIVMGGTLASCSSDPGPAIATNGAKPREIVKLKVMTPLGHSMSFVDLYNAKEQGFWAEQGLDVEVVAGQGTSVAVQAVIGGGADYSEAGGLSTLVAVANEDVPIMHIGTIRQSSQFELLSLPEAPITPTTSLKGLRIGIVSAAGGTASIIQLMAAETGLGPEDITTPITGVGLAAYELAVGGKVDGWISVNTDRAVLASAGKKVHSFNVDEVVFMPSQSMVTTLEVTKSDSDVPTRLLQGLLDAMHFVADPKNEAKAIEALRVYNPELTEAAAKVQLPFLLETWGKPEDFLKMNPAQWTGCQESAKKAGLVTKTVSIDRLIDTKYVDKLVRP